MNLLRLVNIVFIVSVSCLIMAGCNSEPGGSSTGHTTGEMTPEVVSGRQQSDTAVIEGKVVFTRDVASYTYVELEIEGGNVWAAGPAAKINTGDTAKTLPGSYMQNFKSKGLNRTFDSILFTGGFIVNGKLATPDTQMANATNPHNKNPHQENPHGMMGKLPESSVTPPAAGTIKHADGEMTIETVFAERKNYAGKEIRIRGKVMKRSPVILGVHWYHIQTARARPRRTI